MKAFTAILLLTISNLFAIPNEELIKSAMNGDLGGVKRAIKAGADVNARVRDLTSLMIAAGRGHKEIVASLLESNADINIKGEGGKTALSIALRRHQLPTAKLLLEKGCDINTKDDKGVTPLMWAVYEGNMETVKFILENKADPNLANSKEKTALGYAKEKNWKEIEKALKEAGAE
ncbi:MAG: ankyrin repeat domain-containing protein [Leptospiraceae bacterium]|nr:ankyrin repeat domain-containing protein [Leptospiraceae bacterium]